MDFQNQVTWDIVDVVSDVSDSEHNDQLDPSDLNDDQQGTWSGRFLKISKSPTFGAFFGN